jgi:UDP-glucose 4-epimerase
MPVDFPTEIVDMTTHPVGAVFELLAAFQPDLIVHLAAWAKVHQLVKEPEKALENVAMTFWALELARHSKAAVVLGSSREVYGDILRHVTDESMADFVVAGSPYSASKIAGEAFFSSYAKCYNLKTLVFRFSNVYGRYDNDLARMERVIPLFVKKIANNEPITVFGREKMLDFTYIDDCISGIIAGIDKLATSPSIKPAVSDGAGQSTSSPSQTSILNQTINLAYGQGQTLYDLVSLIEMALNKKAQATYAPSQTGEVTRYVADISKAKALLGYSPKMPLTRGISEYVKWCRETGFLSNPVQ